MKHDEIAPLIEKLTTAVESYIPPGKDPEVHALLSAVISAFSNSDEKAILQATCQLENHALFRYAPVVELAGELRRKLEAR